jgi:two-component system chemotaxis response regulator CheY
MRLTPVDVVIADVHMEGMDGIAFVKEVRASDLPRVRDVPIILLSSDRTPETRERGLSAGANDFVEKPVKVDRLCEAVARVLPKVVK